MKDAKGHGSDTGTKGMRLIKTHVMGAHSAKVYNNPEWGEKVVKTFRDGVYQSKNDYHTDDVTDAHGTAMSQLRRWSDQGAQASMASGPKSAPAPVHDSMQSNSRLSSAQGSMSRLKETFHAGNGNNRGGEYGRNVKEAFDRHASVVHEITGKRPNIYDR